ncbi:MAG TPA: DNA-directed RNA polymerase subunit alpha C-terminal domain-containing protein [Solirubrobacteraceae bacterium]|nr:DNA-directed RNA polymerase subunit alpha C-terminal domain-containing protein [Solirubrobacteraceae bacterium]
MASISDRTHDRQRGGAARDPGAPMTGRTMLLFVGMVVTGSVTLGLITSAIASLLVPGNQIGLRPYLVSSLPAVLMLFLAILPGLWCYWCWRQLFPPVERPKRRPVPRRRPDGAETATRAVVPRSGPRSVARPPDPSVTERATADLLKRREERREQAERRRLEERRREDERRREEHRRGLEERRRAEAERVRAAELRRQAEDERRRAVEERRAERGRLAEERRRHEDERRRTGERTPAPIPPSPVSTGPAALRRATPLAELRLSDRVERTLAEAGIETIEQLTAHTQAEVLELDGIGAKSLEHILGALDRAGRALRYPQRFSTIS